MHRKQRRTHNASHLSMMAPPTYILPHYLHPSRLQMMKELTALNHFEQGRVAFACQVMRICFSRTNKWQNCTSTQHTYRLKHPSIVMATPHTPDHSNKHRTHTSSETSWTLTLWTHMNESTSCRCGVTHTMTQMMTKEWGLIAQEVKDIGTQSCTYNSPWFWRNLIRDLRWLWCTYCIRVNHLEFTYSCVPHNLYFEVRKVESMSGCAWRR